MTAVVTFNQGGYKTNTSHAAWRIYYLSTNHETPQSNTACIVVSVSDVLLFQVASVWLTQGLGDGGGCRASSALVKFEISEANPSQDGSVTIVHYGGDSIEADKTFIVTNNRSWTWSDLQSSKEDNQIETRDNVSITMSRDDRFELCINARPREVNSTLSLSHATPSEIRHSRNIRIRRSPPLHRVNWGIEWSYPFWAQ